MARMRKIEKPSPTEAPLLLEFDPQPAEELTALGGLRLVVQAFRSLGLPGSVKRHLVVKERQRGYDEAAFVESFVILNAAGKRTPFLSKATRSMTRIGLNGDQRRTVAKTAKAAPCGYAITAMRPIS